MKRAKFWLIGIGFFVVLAGLPFLYLREPAYKGKPIRQWMAELESSKLEKSEGLSAIGADAVPVLAKALASKESIGRKILRLYRTKIPLKMRKLFAKGMTEEEATKISRQAAFALMAYGFEAKATLPALYAKLNYPDEEVRRLVLATIREVGPGEESIPHLISAWGQWTASSESLRADLAKLLGKVGGFDPNRVVPVLVDCLTDQSPLVSQSAAFALGEIGAPNSRAIPILISLITHDVEGIRFGAAFALGSMASGESAQAKSALQERLTDTSPLVRAGAARALWKQFNEKDRALEVLSGVLTTRNGRKFAAEYLAEFGSEAIDALPALREIALTKETYSLSGIDEMTAAYAAVMVGGSAPDVVPVFQQYLKSNNRWVRAEAARLLGNLEYRAKSVTALLNESSKDPDRNVRRQSQLALQRLAKAEP